MYKLSDLANCVEAISTTRATNVCDFDCFDGYIKNITIHVESEEKVRVYLAGELIESGIAKDGAYDVKAFKKIPFPYVMFPVLGIRVEEPYTMSYDVVTFDKILQYVIYHFGAYHKLTKDKYLHMAQNYIQISAENTSPIYTYPSSVDVKDVVVLESAAFVQLVRIPQFKWMDSMLLPGISSKYTQFDVKALIPCLLYKKEYVDSFIKIVQHYCANAVVTIADVSPTVVLEKNKQLIKRVITRLYKEKNL